MTNALFSVFDQGAGIFRLAPAWVPRVYCVPGRRIKLHPDDYYALGSHRGGIDERWLASTTFADNGPDTSENEGLSFIVCEDGTQILLRDAVEEMGATLIGKRLWNEYAAWPMYSKFFDNLTALPHHVHHSNEHAALTGKKGKPEAYYFPPQMNNHGGDAPYTFFGLNPGTTKDDVRRCLEKFTTGDNGILELSRAHRLVPGTGWDVPPGVLHAPGSMCTYEPQAASDVYAMYQSVIDNRQALPTDLLWKECPPDRMGDMDWLLDALDWETNTDPDFHKNRFCPPVPVKDLAEMQAEGYEDRWITYKSSAFSAKELTILPKSSVVIRDAAAYGCIVVQGHGRMGEHEVECPSLIRYGQLTRDEFFVSESAAQNGVLIENHSDCDALVMLKHFGPENPDLNLSN